ncbi:MAG: hypothetical protein WDN46_08705 [Methylocella sp.]
MADGEFITALATLRVIRRDVAGQIRRYVTLGALETEALKRAPDAVGELAKDIQVNCLASNRLCFHLLAFHAHQGASTRKLALAF